MNLAPVYAAGMMAEVVADFTARMKRLEALACPTQADTPFFNEHVEISNREGMNYREALEFIIRMRHGGSH
jgi:hypothetical protein